VSAEVNVAGVLSSLGPNALASVNVAVEVRDTGADALVGAATIVDDAITDGTVPVSVGNSVVMPLPLTVGHSYRVSLIIRAEAVGSAGDAAGAVSDFVSTASWSSLSVTAGTDPTERIAELEEELDQLRDDFESHSHTYLTGKGAGHNNTEAETGAPLISGGGSVGGEDDGDGVEGDADLCPGTAGGAQVDAMLLGSARFRSGAAPVPRRTGATMSREIRETAVGGAAPAERSERAGLHRKI
jgi:hypothetical protein